jgi:TetR/AcrR family tetracycline transcriptional repressor
MRSLAERLGVKAASLSWHLRSKEELAEWMLEAINAELPDVSRNLPWRQHLAALATEWRRVLLGHRDAARLAMGRFVTRPVTLRRVEMVLATLRAAGFTDTDTANAAYLFSNFVPGFVAEETIDRRPAGETEQPAITTPAISSGRLEIGWARRLTVKADPSIAELYDTYSEGQPPDVIASDGVVRLLRTRGRKPVTLVLNAGIPWEIEIHGGASQLSADLRGLQLRSMSIRGGISALDIVLPVPSGTVPIELRGGSSRLTLHRPAEASARLAVRGGISKLTFDQKPFRSATELTVQSPGYDRASDRYDIVLRGGASRIAVDTAMPDETEQPAAAGARETRSLMDLPASEYPNLVALARPVTSASMDERFQFGLGVLLDGLERRLQAG